MLCAVEARAPPSKPKLKSTSVLLHVTCCGASGVNQIGFPALDLGGMRCAKSGYLGELGPLAYAQPCFLCPCVGPRPTRMARLRLRPTGSFASPFGRDYLPAHFVQNGTHVSPRAYIAPNEPSAEAHSLSLFPAGQLH